MRRFAQEEQAMDCKRRNIAANRKGASTSFVAAFLQPLVVAAAIASGVIAGVAELHGAERDWPCFRGPDRTGVAEDVGLPLTWSDDENIVWKTAIPGAGASSPVTFGDRIYLTSYGGYGLNRESPGSFDDLERHVLALGRDDGRILWDRPVKNDGPDERFVNFVNLHGYASSTPVVDESGVYVFFGTTGVRAYDHDGRLNWERKVGRRTPVKLSAQAL